MLNRLPSGPIPSLPHAAATPSAGGGFHLSCTLPFDSIAQHHLVDDSCGPTGNAKLPDPRALQNRAKNNFCAKGPLVNIDFEVLHQLQQDAEDRGVSFGNDSQIPDDRSELRHLATKAGSIGEGTVRALPIPSSKPTRPMSGKAKARV